MVRGPPGVGLHLDLFVAAAPSRGQTGLPTRFSSCAACWSRLGSISRATCAHQQRRPAVAQGLVVGGRPLALEPDQEADDGQIVVGEAAGRQRELAVATYRSRVVIASVSRATRLSVQLPESKITRADPTNDARPRPSRDTAPETGQAGKRASGQDQGGRAKAKSTPGPPVSWWTALRLSTLRPAPARVVGTPGHRDPSRSRRRGPAPPPATAAESADRARSCRRRPCRRSKRGLQ